MEDSSAHVLRTISYAWIQSGVANVPGTITTTLNDTGQQSSVEYSSYDAYGNAGDVKEHDFGGQVLRHTVTTYTPLVPQHILNLPTQVLIEDTSGNIISRTNLTYDDPNSITINITDAASHYNNLTVHGNLTSISRYSDPVTPGVPVTRHFYYDSTGNVRTAELDCCNQKVFNFSLAKQYAYPDSVVRGTGTLQFTTSADWDFDTGLLKQSTDENGQATGYQYDSMNRPIVVTLPPQGSTSVLINTQYDDNAASPTVTKFASPSTVTVPKTVTTMDGLGHVLRVDTKNGSTVVSSSTVSYDKLWRRSQASNPFGPNETAVNTAFSYDALGRSKLVTPPSGGFTQYDYSGNTVTVTDPAGKQRKNVTDALGRLVEVDEPGVVADHTPANNRATMQTDGNFVLSDILNNPLWSTNTAGLNGSSIEIQDDGNFVLYSFRWQAGVYAAPAQGPFTPQTCSIGHVLNAPQNLLGGQCITSPAGQYMLYMGTDGNFFIYDIAHQTGTWGPGTQGHPGAYASMQTDGNLVVYDVNGVALWSSGTSGTFSERLEMENDGRILIFKSVWNSGTMQAPTTQNLAHPSCDVGTGTGTTGILNGGQCFVSFNGIYQVLLQNDGNFVLSNLSITPPQVLWSTNTALTPLSKIVELSTTYSYDPLNNLTHATQASAVINGQFVSGQPRSYVYDGLGRLTSATTPESGTVTTDYIGSCAGDPSLVCHITDARGIIKTFTYDAINRPKTVSYSDSTPAVTYAYDAGGLGAFALDRLTSITEGSNSHTFVYDNFGRIKSDSQLIDTKTYLISYAYNLASQITSITYPSTTRVVVQNYDAIGRVCAIGASGSTCTTGTRYLNSPTYNAAGEALSVTFGNNVLGNFTYNDHLQLSTLRYFKNSTEILNLAYDYTSGVSGNNGQIQKVHYYTTPGVEDQTKSEQFTYDGFGRLSAAQTLTVNSTPGAKTWSLQWTYDRFGNRLTQSMLAGDPNFPVGQPTLMMNTATNRITNSGYTYDNAGNMTHDANAAYAYDGANRLTAINTTAAVYSYFGPQRVKKVLGSTTTRYIYSGSKLIAEYTNTGNNPPTLSTEYIYAGSKLLVTIAGSTITYHHPDHLSNRAETNASGTRTRTFGQLPFGETWYETGAADKWKFTGYERDSGTGETGLDYANFRYYSSAQARFISADLLSGHAGVPQSLNRYAYAHDPVNNVDPLGLVKVCTVGGMWFRTDQFADYDPHYSSGYTLFCEDVDLMADGGPGAIPSPIGDNQPAGKPNCAGKVITISYNLTVNSDQNGKINGIGIRLAGNDPVDGGRPGLNYDVPANTWAQVTLTASGALNIAFNNHIIIETGFTGAFLKSITFSVNPASHNNGDITQVLGAPDILGFPMGRWDTPSDTLKDALNGNSQLVNMLSTLNAFMNLLHMFDCSMLGGIGSVL
jgi:RHS repeat-associated protein